MRVLMGATWGRGRTGAKWEAPPLSPSSGGRPWPQSLGVQGREVLRGWHSFPLEYRSQLFRQKPSELGKVSVWGDVAASSGPHSGRTWLGAGQAGLLKKAAPTKSLC